MWTARRWVQVAGLINQTDGSGTKVKRSDAFSLGVGSRVCHQCLLVFLSEKRLARSVFGSIPAPTARCPTSRWFFARCGVPRAFPQACTGRRTKRRHTYCVKQAMGFSTVNRLVISPDLLAQWAAQASACSSFGYEVDRRFIG